MPLFIVTFLLLCALIGLYFFFFLRRALSVWGLSVHSRTTQMLLILASIALPLSIASMRSIAALFVLHVFFLALVCDLLHLPFRRLKKVQCVYLSGLVPILLSVIALVFGYFHMQNIQATHYTVETDHVQMRIAFLSDLHYPNAMNAERLQAYCDEISAAAPDLILLGGDIVDEGTTDSEIRECISILSSMESVHGIYFVNGNHDNLFRGFSSASVLWDALQDSGIVLLADQSVQLGELTLIGRKDRSDPSRKPLSQLLPAHAGYVLCVDHQPLDAVTAAAEGCDLMLSGHTHNGQIWPIGYINALLGPKYGQYRFGDMDLIVSSGIVGWAYPVRTQGISEYVILDLTAAR